MTKYLIAILAATLLLISTVAWSAEGFILKAGTGEHRQFLILRNSAIFFSSGVD